MIKFKMTPPPRWVLFKEGGLCTNLNKYFNSSLFMSSVYAPPLLHIRKKEVNG